LRGKRTDKLSSKRAVEALTLQEFRVGIAATWRPAKTPAGGSARVAGERKHRHRWTQRPLRTRARTTASTAALAAIACRRFFDRQRRTLGHPAGEEKSTVDSCILTGEADSGRETG